LKRRYGLPTWGFRLSGKAALARQDVDCGEERGGGTPGCGGERDFRKQIAGRGVIVGDSVPMKALRQQIGIMAPTNGRVLIYGESGNRQRAGGLGHPCPEPA